MVGITNEILDQDHRKFLALTKDFSKTSEFTGALNQVETAYLVQHAEFVIYKVTSPTLFKQFFMAFNKLPQEKLTLDQQRDIQVLYAARCGTLAYEEMNFGVKVDHVISAVELKLKEFLGFEAQAQINTVTTIEKAKAVAFALFTGPRALLKSSLWEKLSLLLDQDTQDFGVIKGVMRKMVEEQKTELLRSGFLLRFKGHPEQNLTPSKNRVKVVFPYGRGAFQMFQEGKTDGSFFNGTELSGIPIHLSSEQMKNFQLEDEAMDIARRTFDDPIVVTAQVPQNLIVAGKMVPIAYEHMTILKCHELPLGDAPLWRKKPVQPEVQVSNFTKIFRAGLTLIGFFVLYKLAKPLYFKVRKWADARYALNAK